MLLPIDDFRFSWLRAGIMMSARRTLILCDAPIMIENNESSMYFLFENPVIIGERIYGVIVNKDGEHGKLAPL